MKNLSFLEKLKIRIKEGVWIKERIELFDSYGLNIYYGESKNSHYDTIWLVQEAGKKVEIEEISNFITNLEYYKIENDGLYMFSKKAIYYLPENESRVKKIFENDEVKMIFGLKVIPNMNIVITPDHEIIRLSKGEIIETFKTYLASINGRIDYLGLISKANASAIPVIVEKNAKYELYIVNDKTIEKTDIVFCDYNNAANALSGKSAIAEYKGKQHIISLEVEKDCNPKFHLEADNITQIESRYYLLSYEKKEYADVVRLKKGIYLDIGKTIKGDYEEIYNQNNIMVFKAKTEGGICVLSISGKQTKTRFYVGAEDVKISKPSLITGDTNEIFSVRVIALYPNPKQ